MCAFRFFFFLLAVVHGVARDVLKMPRELSFKSVNISEERGGLAGVVPSAQWALSEDPMFVRSCGLGERLTRSMSRLPRARLEGRLRIGFCVGARWGF